VPAATIAALWLVSGQFALATLVGLAATLGIGLLIYLWKLMMAPAKLAEEARSRLAQVTEEEDSAERSRRRSVIARLVELYCLELGDAAPAAVRAGLELPPEEWLNEHLAELGEVWHVLNIRGTNYQTFEIIAGEWRYRGRRLRSPAAIKWAAFFDALGLSWDLGSEHASADKIPSPDFYLPELNSWFVVALSADGVYAERAEAVYRSTGKRVIVADGQPAFAKENLTLIDGENAGEGSWTWGEDRRDKDVYWLTKLDGTAGICLGGPGVSTDHDRPPVVGDRVRAAFDKAKEQPTTFERRPG
jgi:hypothetical protein